MALKEGLDMTVEELLNDESIISAEDDPFKIKLSLNGEELGYVGFDLDRNGDGFGCIKSSEEASLFVLVRVAGDQHKYLKYNDKYLTHAMKDESFVSYKLHGAVGFTIVKGADGKSTLKSDYTGQCLSIRTNSDAKLYVRDDYNILDIEIIR